MRVGELTRFALRGLWRQKVRTVLTLVGVTVGTAALAFSLALGFGLRAFIDNEFRGRDDFWRVSVRVGNAPPDTSAVPPGKAAVTGVMSDTRRERLTEVLRDNYLATRPRKPPVMLTPEAVAAIAALPGVSEVRTFRNEGGRVWLGDQSSAGLAVSGGLTLLEPRLIAGRIPTAADAAEVLVSEATLYELGVRDDAALEAVIGRTIQLDVGGVRNARPMALARALTGRLPVEDFTRGQAEALEKLTAALPGALDKFDLTAGERAELKKLLEANPDADDVPRWESGEIVRGEYRIAGVVRVMTRAERKAAGPFPAWELWEGTVFLPPATGEQLFGRLPGADRIGFHSAEVRVTPGGDLPGTVAAIEALGYDTFSSLKWFNNAKREVTMIAAGLNLFALIALFVAGLGITNTLVTSVVERTREIGILKSVGATAGQVKGIFLTEGAVIGLLGSVIGLGLARGLAVPADGYVRRLIEQQTNGEKLISETVFIFPWWLWAGAVLFAVLVTTAAAYYPARRAAGILPVEALKYE